MNSVQPFRAITLNVFPELLAQLQPKHAMLSHNFRSYASILENEQLLFFFSCFVKEFLCLSFRLNLTPVLFSYLTI